MKIEKKNKILFILVFLVISLSMLHLFLQNKGIGLKYEYAKLKVEFRELYDQNRYYNSLVSQHSALARIEAIARKELNMDYPEDVVYVVITGEAR